MRLGFAIEFAGAPARRAAAMQSGIQARFHEGLADAMDGLTADIKGCLNRVVGPRGTVGPLIGFEQDLGMGARAAWGGPSLDQFAEFGAFRSRQGDDVLSGHRASPSKRNKSNRWLV